MESPINQKRALFFEIVESGLADRFDSSSISRVKKLCDYTNGKIPTPKSSSFMHEPCEEYIDNLTAKPWWDANEFKWTVDLEKMTDVISSELNYVLAQQQVFKGDSR